MTATTAQHSPAIRGSAAFPERLRALKARRGMSQRQIAEAVWTSQTTVSFWLSRQRAPGIDTVVLLADLFGVTTDYLLGRTDVEQPHA